MKNIIYILLLAISLNPNSAFAYGDKNNGERRDTFSIRCLLTSPNAFHAAELGESSVIGFADSLAASIKYDSLQSIHLVVVSAADIGLNNLADISWDELLDSAISHGYQPCPAQVGPELYFLSQCVELKNMPVNTPVFVGMAQITKNTKHKILKKVLKKQEEYVFCLKSKGNGKAYQLGYASTQVGDKNFIWSAEDKFIFVK